MSAVARYRIRQIVPSSNVTMDTEVPELFRRREQLEPERSTFHASRMRMTEVTAGKLAATAICTAHRLMRAIGMPAEASGAGTLLGGGYALAQALSPAGVS
jgi:maleate cis-trans isomerase